MLEIFKEGQARSVERNIGLKMCNEKDNPAPLLYQLKARQIPEMRDAYLWLTKSLEVAHQPSLLQGHKGHDILEGELNLYYHALGNAFFSLLEAREGPEVHKEIMAGRYQLPSF